jgi:hypothetical protein
MRGEVSWVALEERPASEKTAEVPVPVEAAGANVTPHINSGCVNEVEPQLEDTPDGAALIPGSPRGPSFSPPCETASDDMGSAPESFDIVEL